MEPTLAGRVALVTGGSRNIGREIACRLASEGAAVALTYRSDFDGAQETVSLIEKAGGRAACYQASLEEPNVHRPLAELVESDLGPIDVLVNSAAIRPRYPLGEMTPEAFERVFSLNVRAPHLLTDAIAPGMAARGFGRLLFMGGLSAYIGQESRGLVMASKLALVGIARSYSFELASKGVTSNVIVPGRVDTERGDVSRYGPAVDREARAKTIPVGHLGSVADVANTIAYLASPQAAFITGQEIFLTGGAYPLTKDGVG